MTSRLTSAVRARLLCMALAGAAASCGGAAPPPAQPTPSAPPPTRAVVAVGAPDLSPVPEPAHLVALVRWKSPAATFASLHGWTGLPIGPNDLLDALSLSDLAQVIAYDAPVDVAVALNPAASGLSDWEPFAAVATGLKSLEDGRRLAETLGSVTEIRPGVHKLHIRGGGRRHREKASCLLSAAAGTAPARLVCGRRDRDLDELSAYLTRTVPSQDLGAADLHAEVRFPPLAQTYGTFITEGLHVGAAMIPERLALGEPTFDRALRRAAVGVADELAAVAGDLDRLTIEAALQPDQADFSLELRMRDRQSWTASTMASMTKRAGLAPPSFWRIPADAQTAAFSFSAEPRRLAEIWRTLKELLDGYLQHEKVPPADRAALTDLLSPSYMTGAPLVGASGPDWTLWGIAEPTRSREWLVNAIAACQRPKLLALAGKLAADQLGGSPKIAKPAAPIRCKAATTPAGLPKGTLAFEVTFSGVSSDDSRDKAAGKKKTAARRPATEKIHLLLASDAGETWLAFGADRAKLVTPLSAVMRDTGGASLARREGLEALRQRSLTGGGFVTLEVLARVFQRAESEMTGKRPPDGDSALEQTLGATPHRGRTPMVFSATVTDAGAVAWKGHFRVPKAVVEDVVVLGATSALKGP